MVPLLTCLEKLCNGLMEYFKLNSILDNFLSKLPPNKWLQTKQILEIFRSSHPNAMQLYWNRTSAWVFSCKFSAYFQNSFDLEHLWVAVSGCSSYINHQKNTIFEKQILVINSNLRDCKQLMKYSYQHSKNRFFEL